MWWLIGISAGLVVISLYYRWLTLIGKTLKQEEEKVQKRLGYVKRETGKVKTDLSQTRTFVEQLDRYSGFNLFDERIGLSSAAKTVAEHTRELANEITGHRVNMWLYWNDNGKQIERIVVAGHANGPVCRMVSSALNAAYYRRSKIDPEDFFVTGAGVLVNTPEERPKEPSQLSLKDQLAQLMTRKSMPNPLGELLTDLRYFQNVTGLVTLHEHKLSEYTTLKKNILSEIKRIQNTGRTEIFGINNPQAEGLLLDMPIYRLSTGKPVELTIQLTEAEFDCKEYKVLKNRHQRNLIHEMLEDVKRRNRVYREWHQNDKDKQRYLSSKNPSEMMTISGSRIYESGEIVQTSNKQISIGEYLTHHLPGLLQEDQRWIQRTDFELKRLNTFLKDAGKTDILNETLLIDSFLRGWPSIFFENRQERDLYDRWLNLKRENVWKRISKELIHSGLDPSTLLHTNLVFKVVEHQNHTYTIMPMYFLLSNAYLVLVDCQYKIARYLHPWEFRERLPLLVDNAALPAAQKHLVGDQLFDLGIRALENGDIEQCKTYLSLALRSNAVPTFKKLVDYWWNVQSKDTRIRLQEKFTDYNLTLLRGLSIPDQDSQHLIPSRKKDLISCITLHPDALPDPYIYLAILEIIPEFYKRQDELYQKHFESARQRFMRVKEDFANNRLLPEVTRSGSLQPEEFNKLSDPLLAEGKPGHPEKERIYERLFMMCLRMRLKELNYDKASKERQTAIFTKALSDLDAQKLAQAGITAYARGEIQASNIKISLVQGVQADEKALSYWQKARSVDPELVQEIEQSDKIIRSERFWNTIGHYHQIIKANRFMEINDWIVQILVEWKQYPAQKDKMNSVLKQEIALDLPLEPEEERMMASIKEARKKLLEFDLENPDNMYLPIADLRSARAELLNTAAKLYETAPVFDLMEPNKARIRIASQNHAAYQKALEIMFQPTRPLQLLTRDLEHKILDTSLPDLTEVVRLGCTRQNGALTIKAIDQKEKSIDLFQIEKLDHETLQYLSEFILQPNWKESIRSTGKNAAEMLLNSPLPLAPAARRFSSVMTSPEISTILIHIMAYSNHHLVPEALHAEQLVDETADLETTHDNLVIGDVKIDLNEVCQRLIKKIEAKRN